MQAFKIIFTNKKKYLTNENENKKKKSFYFVKIDYSRVYYSLLMLSNL